MRPELRLGAAAAVVALSLLTAGCGGSADTFKIGVIVDCQGTFAAYSEDSLAGASLPLLARGGRLAGRKPSDGVEGARVAGRSIELHQGCGEVTYLTQLVENARRLIEEEKVDVLVAPMLGQTEGVVLRELAHRYPKVAFVLANSAAQEPTLRDPAPNLFRFVADGAQASAGLGSYAYHDLGWRRTAVVLPDSPYSWPRAAGFVAEFCALGGQVERLPAPAYASASVLPRIGKDVDGVALFTEIFPDTLGFATAFAKVQPDLPRHLLLGPASFTFADPKLFVQGVVALRNLVVGDSTQYVSADPAWLAFVGRVRKALPRVGKTEQPGPVPARAPLLHLGRSSPASARAGRDGWPRVHARSGRDEVRLADGAGEARPEPAGGRLVVPLEDRGLRERDAPLPHDSRRQGRGADLRRLLQLVDADADRLAAGLSPRDAASLGELGGGPERPGEACHGLAGSEPARAQAAAHEQGRDARHSRDFEPRPAEPLHLPATRQADDEQRGVRGRLQDSFRPAPDEQGLRNDAHHRLHDERRAPEQPACVTAAAEPVG